MFFLFSLLLMVWVSLRWASHLMGSPADRFWVFVAALMLQVGAITGLTSLVHQLTPAGWLLVQVVFLGVTLRWAGGARPDWQGGRAAWARLHSGCVSFASELSAWGAMALLSVCVLLLTSLALQMALPIEDFDDRMYHASRVIYWIQHQSVFPFETHNLRQTIVPFGSELFFLWPVLLTKSEVVGRVVFWSALPLAAVGQYVLLRALHLGKTAALVGVLILISTPRTMLSAVGLRPEIWSVLALLGLAYWAVSLGSETERAKHRCFYLGVFAVLSINVRSFPVSILPSLVLVIWWAGGRQSFVERLKAWMGGLALAGVLSTLIIPLGFNALQYRDPLGPQEVQRVVRADLSWQTAYTHAVRFASLLLELPDVPASVETRDQISGSANRLIAMAGAGVPLSGEAGRPWPGPYKYELPVHATRFSLWGLLWIPVSLAGLVHLLRRWRSGRPTPALAPVAVLTLLAVPLTLAVLLGSRWMASSDVPGRFLAGPYALTLALGLALIAPRWTPGKIAQALLALLLVYGAYQPLRVTAYDAVQAMADPPAPAALNEPFAEVAGALLPPGARVLLVGDQDARDYPLFAPADRFSRAVIPWGSQRFDPSRMDRLIASEKVTHVLIQNDERVVLEWYPAIDTQEMVRWLSTEPGLEPVPLKTPRMRLYKVSGNTALSERAFATMALPVDGPLIKVDRALQGRVGMDLGSMRTPWAVEKLGGTQDGFLWLGQGYSEGLEFGLWARQEAEVDLRFRLMPGPGVASAGRTVLVLHDGRLLGDEHRFEGVTTLVLRTRLHAGRNTISLFPQDFATVTPPPGGDTRNLVVGVAGVAIEEARGAMEASPAGDDGLVQRARMAQALIAQHQQSDGYWLTAFTEQTVYDLPRREMNTYVTSLMVDLLGQGVDRGVLSGSLGRAETHLRRQIEDGGLVRYHGRPDGRAMSLLHLCPITPDSDDTALAWRIAPGEPEQQASALHTLKRYRDAEGLYKTWLGSREDYRCIDPGANPNPPDVGIQMHLLLWLAQVDPPESQALCSALRKTIDQERLWVYYRRAPLVPLLRQPDLKAAGCELALPEALVKTGVPGQQVWVDAVRMLVQLESAQTPAPGREPVLALLQKLSKDRFAAVRQTPPMLYHNDLSASVSRYYWSEDVGYAIWLRLYQLGMGSRP